MLGTNLTGDTTGLLRVRVAFPRAQAPPQPWARLGAEQTAAVDSAPLPRPCTPQPGRVLLVCGTLPAFNAHVRGPKGNAARGENTLRCGHVIAKSQGDGRGDVPRGARAPRGGPTRGRHRATWAPRPAHAAWLRRVRMAGRTNPTSGDAVFVVSSVTPAISLASRGSANWHTAAVQQWKNHKPDGSFTFFV